MFYMYIYILLVLISSLCGVCKFQDSETKLDVNILDRHCTKIVKFASYEKLRELLTDMFNRYVFII